jgi:hypothetical protein
MHGRQKKLGDVTAPASQFDDLGDVGDPVHTSGGRSLFPLSLLAMGILAFFVMSDGPKRERYP